MKVSIGLGLTICTSEESRNFARFNFEIAEIDTAGDVQAQAQEGVSAVLTAFAVGNEGMEEAVTTALTELSATQPTGVRDEIAQLQSTLERVTTKLIPNIVGKVKELAEQVESPKGGAGEAC